MTAKSSKLPILVPVDFSAHSALALLKACELAGCTKQQIIVLHVVHDPGEMPGYYTKAMISPVVGSIATTDPRLPASAL